VAVQNALFACTLAHGGQLIAVCRCPCLCQHCGAWIKSLCLPYLHFCLLIFYNDNITTLSCCRSPSFWWQHNGRGECCKRLFCSSSLRCSTVDGNFASHGVGHPRQQLCLCLLPIFASASTANCQDCNNP
ncbi:unnamed protein product, partial [Ixodes pacificus]